MDSLLSPGLHGGHRLRGEGPGRRERWGGCRWRGEEEDGREEEEEDEDEGQMGEGEEVGRR